MQEPYPYPFIADVRSDELPSARSKVAAYLVDCPLDPCEGYVVRLVDGKPEAGGGVMWTTAEIYDGALGQCDMCGEVCTVFHPQGPEA